MQKTITDMSMSCVLSVIQARQSTSELGDYSVPDGCGTQTPVFNKAGDVPGAPVKWSDPENPEDAQPGYGYVADDTASVEETYYYHSDHLGSTSYITDDNANITQYDAYLPYGELLIDEHNSSEEMPYKFNGKEMDEETGLYYYGARYMNPVASIWYGVDPLAEKYPNIGGYVYCIGNPIRFIDPNGEDSYYDKNGNYIGNDVKQETDNIIIVSSFNVINNNDDGSRNVVLVDKKPIEDTDLSATSYSKIFTDVLRRKGCDVNELENGQLSVCKYDRDENSQQECWNLTDIYNVNTECATIYVGGKGEFALTSQINDKFEVKANVYSDSDKGIFKSESNIYNMLGVHEFHGHGELHIKNDRHWRILDLQQKDPSWNKTTSDFKMLYDNLKQNYPEYVKPNE